MFGSHIRRQRYEGQEIIGQEIITHHNTRSVQQRKLVMSEHLRDSSGRSGWYVRLSRTHMGTMAQKGSCACPGSAIPWSLGTSHVSIGRIPVVGIPGWHQSPQTKGNPSQGSSPYRRMWWAFKNKKSLRLPEVGFRHFHGTLW